MKKSKLIASVVVFKELHDSNKDIYDIIAEFLKATIIINKKWNFNSTEITLLLENEFDFKLPEAVIKTTLKKRLVKSKFVNLDNAEYTVNNTHLKIDPEFEATYENKKNLYSETEEEFISFIKSKRKTDLSDTDIECLRENIKHYLLGNGVSVYYTEIG